MVVIFVGDGHVGLSSIKDEGEEGRVVHRVITILMEVFCMDIIGCDAPVRET